MSLRSQKYGFGIRDQRSGIRKKHIPDPGSKGTRSRIRIRNTGQRYGSPDPDPYQNVTAPQHCFNEVMICGVRGQGTRRPTRCTTATCTTWSPAGTHAYSSPAPPGAHPSPSSGPWASSSRRSSSSRTRSIWSSPSSSRSVTYSLSSPQGADPHPPSSTLSEVR